MHVILSGPREILKGGLNGCCSVQKFTQYANINFCFLFSNQYRFYNTVSAMYIRTSICILYNILSGHIRDATKEFLKCEKNTINCC